MTKNKLIDLREAMQKAYDHYVMISRTNRYGKTPEELVDLDLAFDRAINRYIAAVKNYETARSEFLEEGNDL